MLVSGSSWRSLISGAAANAMQPSQRPSHRLTVWRQHIKPIEAIAMLLVQCAHHWGAKRQYGDRQRTTLLSGRQNPVPGRIIVQSADANSEDVVTTVSNHRHNGNAAWFVIKSRGGACKVSVQQQCEVRLARARSEKSCAGYISRRGVRLTGQTNEDLRRQG